MKVYKKSECITFAKVSKQWGQLHNMAPNFPITINGTYILTSEHLYQALKFSDHPEVQEQIISVKSPMAAKYIAIANDSKKCSNWDEIKVDVMKWCILVKLIQNWDTFSYILLDTEGSNIVEYSSNDNFWGAKPNGNSLIGHNVLGRMLTTIAAAIKKGVINNRFKPKCRVSGLKLKGLSID